MATQLTQVTFPTGDYIKDTNTWRGIQDNLTSSTNTTESLSAKQGYLLANGSARDDTKLPLAGGTMTGQIVLASTGYKTYNTGGYTLDQYGNFKHQSSDTSQYWNIQNNAGTNKFSVYWETGNVTAAGNITAPKFIGALDEANLKWGGKNFSADFGCIDAALMDELRANRFQFIKASAITVEYSRDGGSTWTDYGATDTQKQQIFAQGGGLIIGKADSTNKATEHPGLYQLRITIDTGVASIYSYLNKFIIYVSSSGSANCACKIQKALQSTPTAFVDHTDWIPVGGWSGYNVLNTSYLVTYGNSASSQYGRVRFIFKDGEGGNTNYIGLSILQIKAFGGVGWNTPSTMAKTGHIYSYDQAQNAIFPNVIQAPYHRATTKMTLSSGKISQVTTGHTMLFADGIAISNPATANDQGWIRVLGTGESDTIMEIATGDDGGAGEQIAVRQYNTSSAIVNEAILLDKSGNTTFPKNVTATKFIGALQGNADTATSATSASKLGSSNVGSATQPIYLNAGSPAACTYTLGKSVPSDAVFTDTNNAVTQTPTTVSATYELLFSGSADNTEHTESARKSQYATFNPGKAAFTFGTRLTGSTVGSHSYAEGEDVIASEECAHAEGRETTASNLYSHAEGCMTIASGGYSHAEGYSTQASGETAHAESNSTIASGNYSHAEGALTTASGHYSHTEGYLTVASGSTASHAEGYKTTASGYMSHAEGAGTISSKEYSHAEGDTSQANGVASHSEGYFCIASTSNTHAEGEKTTASGKSSHTEGYHTKTASYYTHAEGDSSYAGYIGAHAEGGGSTATGHYSHAEGQQTLSSSTASHAEGYFTTANGVESHAEGLCTIANHASQHVFGEYNIPDPSTTSNLVRGDYVEIVGNGDVSASSNARTLDWDGNETLAGSLNLNGGNVNLGTSSSASDDSGDIAFFYGNGQEKARIFSANEFTSYDDLNYRCYKKDGTLLGNSHLATRKDIVPISGGKAITTSTSMSYTGLSFVVPPYSVASVTVRAVWQNAWPKIIGVSTSSSSQGSSLIASNVQYSGVGHLSTAVNYYNASSSNLTLYIWAQYSSASSNTINYWGYSQRYDA